MGFGLYALPILMLLPEILASNGTGVLQVADDLKDSNETGSYNGLVSLSQLRTGFFVMVIVIKPIVCISGFVMNVIGIWVLLDKSLRHSSYRYLLGLLVADSGFLLCGILHIPSDVIRTNDRVRASYIEAVLDPPIRFYAEHAFSKVSAITICILAFERLLAILKPLKVKDMVLSRHAGKINIAVFVTIFLLYIPILFDVRFVFKLHKRLNLTLYIIEPQVHSTSIRRFVDLYRLIIEDIVMRYVPFFCLLLCNLAIWIQLYRIRKRRKIMFGAASLEQSKVTLTLLVISGFFMVTYIPLIATSFLVHLYPDKFGLRKQEQYLMRLLQSGTGLSWSVNSANDFIIYLATNLKFRSAFKKMFPCRVKRHTSSESTPKTSETRIWTPNPEPNGKGLF